MKWILILLLLVAPDALAACQTDVLGGREISLRADHGRVDRLVQIRVTCEQETKGWLFVEADRAPTAWGTDVMKITSRQQDATQPIPLTADSTGTVVELYISTRLHKYSKEGQADIPVNIRFDY